GNVEAIYQSALLLELQGRFQESLDHLKRLPPEARNRPQALAVLCADETGLGHSAAASRAADELLQSPELSEADVMTAMATVESHDEKLAIRLLEGLVTRKLASAAQLAHLGILYGRTGQLARARNT